MMQKKPYCIDNGIVIFGYCEFGKPYLKQIQVAATDKPGINPLRKENIIKDLSTLSEGHKAILYFHWGREHVWLPPHYDIQLAKQLLEDNRVLAIIGMHAHRAQGYLRHNGKKAYMCLGNFLFPNFYISPPTQICYPETVPATCLMTRQYHSVSDITYKKWRLANRISLGVQFDTESHRITHFPMKQADNIPQIKEMKRINSWLLLIWIEFLSIIYLLPSWAYIPLERISTFLTYKLWNYRILVFWIKQNGLRLFVKKASKKIRSRRIW